MPSTRSEKEYADSERVAVVAGHFMFWPEDEAGQPAHTRNNLETFTHTLCLDVPTELQPFTQVTAGRKDSAALSLPRSWHFVLARIPLFNVAVQSLDAATRFPASYRGVQPVSRRKQDGRGSWPSSTVSVSVSQAQGSFTDQNIVVRLATNIGAIRDKQV